MNQIARQRENPFCGPAQDNFARLGGGRAEAGGNAVLNPVTSPGTARGLPEEEVVGWRGLEPRTNALKGHCSTN